MCGIAGWQFHPSFKPTTAWRSLLLAWLAGGMDRRGGDSYGIAKLTPAGGVKTWKGLKYAMGNLNIEQTAANSNQLLLHTRKATHGAISVDNAHPLRHEHILGTHNGMIYNHDDINKKYKRDFDLDSRHLFEHLSKGLSFADLRGYGVISYLDLNQPDIINFCRLTGTGDLVIYGLGKDKENTYGLIYASTADPIEGALKALKQENFKYLTIDDKRRHYAREGSLYIDRSKEGEMPFGQQPFQSTSHRTSSPVRGFFQPLNTDSDELWELPKGLKICKRCRKKRKRLRAGFYASLLCSDCWLKYKANMREEWVGIRSIGHTVKKVENTPFKYFYCHKNCGRHALVEVGTTKLCYKCYDKEREDVETVEDPVINGTVVLPAELDQWDLCGWCADDCSTKRRFDVKTLCSGCNSNFDEMITALRTLSKESREYFCPVVVCATPGCNVPTFGWLKTLAFEEGDYRKPRIAKCKGCRLLSGTETVTKDHCVDCGIKDPTGMSYSVVKGGALIPRCKLCHNKKRGDTNHDVITAA